MLNGNSYAKVNIYTVSTTLLSKCNELDCSDFIIGGDLNTNLHRDYSTFTKYLKDVCAAENLKMCSAYRNQSVNYTYTSPADNTTFTIDHFLVIDSMFNKISCYKSIHDGNNLSFLSPVLLVIDIDIIYCPKNSKLDISVPKWQVAKNVQINNYR